MLEATRLVVVIKMENLKELNAKSLRELKEIWRNEEQLTNVRFDIIIAMLSEDPRLYEILKDFFEQCELITRIGMSFQ